MLDEIIDGLYEQQSRLELEVRRLRRHLEWATNPTLIAMLEHDLKVDEQELNETAQKIREFHTSTEF